MHVPIEKVKAFAIEQGFDDSNLELALHALIRSRVIQDDLHKQLEYLGDGVLLEHARLYLYHQYWEQPRRYMACWERRLVCNKTLTAAAVELEMDRWLWGDDNAFRPPGWEGVLADNMEAFLAAMVVGGLSHELVYKFLVENVFARTPIPEFREDVGNNETKFRNLMNRAYGGYESTITHENIEGPGGQSIIVSRVWVFGSLMGIGKGENESSSSDKAYLDAFNRFEGHLKYGEFDPVEEPKVLV